VVLLATVEATVLAEGVKFLYGQATQLLKAWRARRDDPDSPPPCVLPAPAGVDIGTPRPLARSPAVETEDALRALSERAAGIEEGGMPIESPAALEIIDALRDLVEAALGAPVQFAGEPPRSPVIANINVVTQRVTGEVRGLRADLDKLGNARVSGVRVETGDVEADGSVTGVDLT
jgi:hypothetical protein